MVNRGGVEVLRGLVTYVTGKEKTTEKIAGVETGITKEADAMAVNVGKMVREDTDPAERDAAREEMAQEINRRLVDIHKDGVIHSMEELDAWLVANEARMKGMDHDERGLVQIAYDFKDAVALAMVANAGRDRLSARLQENAVQVDAEHVIDIGLGVTGGTSGVLRGMGTEVLKTMITENNLLKPLRKLQIQMEEGNAITGIRAAMRTIEEIWEKDPDSAENELLFRYVNALQGKIEGEQRGGRGGGAGEEDGIRLRNEIDNLPDDVEKQRALARKLLEKIEAGHLDPWGIPASEFKGYLDDLSQNPKLDKEVGQEIETRLRLQRITGAMVTAGGWLGDRTPNPIMSELNKAAGDSGLFTIDDMRFLLRGKGGLSVAIANAWNKFEEINIGLTTNPATHEVYGNYHQILEDIRKDADFCAKWKVGEIPDFYGAGKHAPEIVDKEGFWSNAYDNYFLDGNADRKKVVQAFMAKKIMEQNRGSIGAEKRDMTEYEATKGVELAWNLLVASGESAVFNTAFAEHNDLAEFMLTKYDTLDRMSAKKMKTIGAFTCLQRVVSLGPTWPRFISDRTIFGQLKAEDINVEGMAKPKMTIDYWYGAMVTQKLYELKNVMRSEDASPKEVASPSGIKKIGEWVNKAAKYSGVILDANGKPILGAHDTVDSEGRPLIVTGEAADKRARRIRLLLVAGWAEQARSNIDLGWDTSTWKAFSDMLTREYSFDEADLSKKSSFVSKEDMEYIERTILSKIKAGPITFYGELKKLESIRETNKKSGFSVLRPDPKIFEI